MTPTTVLYMSLLLMTALSLEILFFLAFGLSLNIFVENWHVVLSNWK